MTDLKSILNKYGYNTSNSKDYLYVTQDGTSGFLRFIVTIAAGAFGWFIGKQDPDLKELENDPFITGTTFYKILDFIGTLIQWGFFIGAVLVGIYMVYGLIEKGNYQLSINKDTMNLNGVGGNVSWPWIEIKDFTIDNTTESLYAEHSSGEKKKLFEFYSKDKTAVNDLNEIKKILLSYKNGVTPTTE